MATPPGAPYARRVHTSKLTREQVERVQAAVRPMLGYVGRLAERMQKLGWDASDPAYKAAWAAYYELHTLNVHLQYAGCAPGTAGKRSEPPAR